MTKGKKMATATKKERRNTPWKPVLWDRRYRGLSIWVEEVHTTAPRWNWTTEEDAEGRAVSRTAAMRAAMASVDDIVERVAKKRTKGATHGW